MKRPYELIKSIQPDVLPRREDWKKEDIIGSDIAKETYSLPYIEGISTTGIIEKIEDSAVSILHRNVSIKMFSIPYAAMVLRFEMRRSLSRNRLLCCLEYFFFNALSKQKAYIGIV